MSNICAQIKPNGEPCQARSLPNSPFCLFHDPHHQEAQADARSKGGATPRRRIRRFPLVLDHLHVAQLLSELFVDALNYPESFDPKRLQALTGLSRMLLKAVGTPPAASGCFKHSDRSEPSAEKEYLLRFYSPLSPEAEALLEAEPPTEPHQEHINPPPAQTEHEIRNTPYPAPNTGIADSQNCVGDDEGMEPTCDSSSSARPAYRSLEEGSPCSPSSQDYRSADASPLSSGRTAPPEQTGVCTPGVAPHPFRGDGPHRETSPDPGAAQAERQGPEQAANRSGTGATAANDPPDREQDTLVSLTDGLLTPEAGDRSPGSSPGQEPPNLPLSSAPRRAHGETPPGPLPVRFPPGTYRPVCSAGPPRRKMRPII